MPAFLLRAFCVEVLDLQGGEHPLLYFGLAFSVIHLTHGK